MSEPLRIAWKERPWSQGRWTAVHIVNDPPELPQIWANGKESAVIRKPLKMLCGVIFPGTDACDNYEIGDFDGLNSDCKRCAKKAGVELNDNATSMGIPYHSSKEHLIPYVGAVCPRCAELEHEVESLTAEYQASWQKAMGERDQAIFARNAARALLRELVEAVREFYGDPQEERFDTPSTARLNALLRRAQAEVGEVEK